MVMKKVFAIMLAIIVAVLSFVDCIAIQMAAIGSVEVALPEITVEIKNIKELNKEDVKATLDSENIEISDVFKYSESKVKSRIYILIDISTSISMPYFNCIKDCIAQFAENINQNDEIVLLTFGDDVKEILSGGESVEEIKDAINGLERNGGATDFNDALVLIQQLSQKVTGKFDREYALVFSDGIDNSYSGSTTDGEVKELVDHSLPLYGMCVSDTYEQNINTFAEICRKTGGTIVEFNTYDCSDKFSKLIDDINSSWFIKLDNKTNYCDKHFADLTVNISNSAPITVTVNMAESQKDNSAPKVIKTDYSKENNVLTVSFSEDIIGVNTNSVSVTYANKKEIAVDSIRYSNAVMNVAFKEAVYSGDITILFKGVTDNSLEKNAIESEYVLTLNATPLFVKYLKAALPFFIAIVVLACAFVFLKVMMKKKNVKHVKELFVSVNESDIEVKHVIKNTGISVTFNISNGKTGSTKASFNITNGIFAGRASSCDLCVEDYKMSRQHFCIHNLDGKLFIEDLNSSNGTFVNGIKLSTKSELSSGDSINAGLTSISVVF